MDLHGLVHFLNTTAPSRITKVGYTHFDHISSAAVSGSLDPDM